MKVLLHMLEVTKEDVPRVQTQDSKTPRLVLDQKVAKDQLMRYVSDLEIMELCIEFQLIVTEWVSAYVFNDIIYCKNCRVGYVASVCTSHTVCVSITLTVVLCACVSHNVCVMCTHIQHDSSYRVCCCLYCTAVVTT